MPVYTKPEHTWSVREMANAALLNQFQRDNMRATLHRIAYKTADESVANTTLQNDDHLLHAPPASTTWYYRWFIICAQPSPVSFNADIKIAFTFTSGVTFTSWTEDSGGGLTKADWTSSGTSQALEAYTGATQKNVHVIEGIAVSSGTVQLQWAQSVADTAPTKVYAGSSLWGADVT